MFRSKTLWCVLFFGCMPIMIHTAHTSDNQTPSIIKFYVNKPYDTPCCALDHSLDEQYDNPPATPLPCNPMPYVHLPQSIVWIVVVPLATHSAMIHTLHPLALHPLAPRSSQYPTPVPPTRNNRNVLKQPILRPVRTDNAKELKTFRKLRNTQSKFH